MTAAVPSSRNLQIVLIAGYGHSGSTVFEQVLAQDPTFVALGEMKWLWQRGYLSDVLCGCGVAFYECPFWHQVDQAAFGGLDRERAREIRNLARDLLHRSNIPRLLLRRREHRLEAYHEHLRAAVRAALDVTGASIAVDSSKDGIHGLVLGSMSGVTLHVIHLVRDARAVGFSWQRERVRPEIHWETRLMPKYSPARSGVAWLYRNLVATAVRRSAGSYLRVRYEDFVQDPNAVIEAVRRNIGLASPSWPVVVDERVELPETHQVSGNPVRFGSRSVELVLDDEWRRAMPRLDRMRVVATSWPLLLWYGYLGGRRASERAVLEVLD
jgi:hypothetical protein